MNIRNVVGGLLMFLLAAVAGNWALNRSYASDPDFIEAEEIIRKDEFFTTSFGHDAEIYPAGKTTVNRLPPQRSYKEMGFRVRAKGEEASSDYLTIRIYEVEDAEARYELKVQ